MVYLSVPAGHSQICVKMVYSNSVSITSFLGERRGVGGRYYFEDHP